MLAEDGEDIRGGDPTEFDMDLIDVVFPEEAEVEFDLAFDGASRGIYSGREVDRERSWSLF